MTKKIRIATLSVILIVVFGIFYTSCKKEKVVEPVEPETKVATSIELVSGGDQTATVETAIASPVVVLVKDQDGNVFEGTTVNFTVTEGSVSAATGTTDAEGKATVNWTLGARIGKQTLTVIAYKTDGTTALTGSPISVTATGAGTVTDVDGNVYQTVKIGNQIWMAEDLKVSHYPNGDAIPYIDDNATWGALADDNRSDAYSFYGDSNNDGIIDVANPDYGALYTYAAAIGDNWARDKVDNQGVCPEGWHLPTDAEWTELTDYLGGNSVAGGKLKETGISHWNKPNLGATNESGFSALSGGIRYNFLGTFDSAGLSGHWWSATESSGSKAWSCFLYYKEAEAYRIYYFKADGFSVRCVRD